MITYLEYHKRLGENIKKYRKAKGLTQDKLAELTSFHRVFIAQLEKPDGRRSATLETLFILAECLDVQIKDLLDFESLDCKKN